MMHSDTRLVLPIMRPRESGLKTAVIVNGEMSAFFEVNVPDHVARKLPVDELDDATPGTALPF